MKKLVVGILCCAVAVFLIGAAGDSESAKSESAQSETAKNITPSSYAWVALQVSDVSEAKKFFTEKLNFKGEWMNDYYLIQIAEGQYLVLIGKQVPEAKTDGAMVAFHVKDVDAYFEQVTSAGVEAIDYIKEHRNKG